MKQYRTIIRPDDPKINIQITEADYQLLKGKMAQKHRKRLSEEVTIRLLATLKERFLSTDMEWLHSLAKGKRYGS